jgi:hypothetical protein
MVVKHGNPMKLKIPPPISGGLILSHKCNASCIQCMYACSPHWKADWMSEEDLGLILNQLAGCIGPSVYGPDYVDLSHGLHYTGGEPFLNYELLLKAAEIGEELGIPSTFVETNCFWAKDDKSTRDKLSQLKDKGLKGVMISINPFYLEYIPFERTLRAAIIGSEIFGPGLIPYQLEYFKKFQQLNIKGTLTLEQYFKIEDRDTFTKNVEFFLSGRSAFRIEEVLPNFFHKYPTELLCQQPCSPDFIRVWHNHFDNYHNFMPGYCGGITLGDVRYLDKMINEGIDVNKNTPLWFLAQGDFYGLIDFACGLGYEKNSGGYLSKCHMCADIRKYLVDAGDFDELSPKEFYKNL